MISACNKINFLIITIHQLKFNINEKIKNFIFIFSNVFIIIGLL